MGKFGAARSSGATDTKLQAAHNQLVSLLETGQVFESLINGHRVRIELNASGGFSGILDGVQMFGLDATTGLFTIDAYDDLFSALTQALNDKLSLSGGTLTGVVEADSNTEYTTRQIRNVILSTEVADVDLMQDGDIWMQYT